MRTDVDGGASCNKLEQSHSAFLCAGYGERVIAIYDLDECPGIIIVEGTQPCTCTGMKITLCVGMSVREDK
jgi:hypothetical protein